VKYLTLTRYQEDMKPIRASVTIILIAVFCSCEKNNQIENADTELLIKVQSNGELFMEYSYNESNLVIEEKSKFHYTKHTYDKSNYLIESEFYMDPAMYSSSSSVLQEAMNRKEWASPDNTEKSLTQRFEYDEDGRLSKKFYIRPGSTNTEYLSFEYENDRIIKQSSYFNNVLRGFTNFYYDQNGNLVKQVSIAQSGKGQVTINANELAQGTYTYTLEVNGASVDTKLMVVTK